MKFAPPSHPTLSWALSVQVWAFVLFHLTVALFSHVGFARVVAEHGWVGDAAYVIGRLGALYGPVLLYGWACFNPAANKAMMLGFAIVTLASAYVLIYPVLTGLLQLLGQFDVFGEFWFEHLAKPSD